MATQAIMGRGASRFTRTAWPAGVPIPVQNCDGSWRTPLWIPEKHRWELSEWEDEPIRLLGSREWCGDPECSALHEEDFDTKKLAWFRRCRPELTPRGPRRVARRVA